MSRNKKNIRSKDKDFKVIEKASEIVYEKLRADETYPDLADQFSKRLDQPGSHKYFANYKNVFGSMIEHVDFLSFPRVLKDQLNLVQTTTYMGIFPEIDKVWITVDNILYLWNYKQPQEYDKYDGLSEVIVSVSLSAPKPGVFLETVKYVLIVATAVEVALLALSFDGSSIRRDINSSSDSMKIIPTSFMISSDDTSMMKVIGSQSGRIFMAGEDGNLYELDYDNVVDSWATLLGVPSLFGVETARRKCQKVHHYQWNWRLISFVPAFLKNLALGEDPMIDICIDNVRNTLYTLTSKGYMSVFTLGSDRQTTICGLYNYNLFDSIKKYVQDRVYNDTSHQVEGLKDLSNVKIIGLFTIPITESKKVHLLALLNTGVRVYIKSIYSTSRLSDSSNSRTPTNIDIVFIRSPPPQNAINCSHPKVPLETGMDAGILPTYSSLQTLNVRNGYYCQGILLTALSSSDDQSDKLVAIYEDLMNQNLNGETLLAGQIPNLREAISIVTLPTGDDLIQGRIFDIKEKDISLTSRQLLKLQTLVTLSTTPPSSQTLYQDEEIVYRQKEILYTDGMVHTLPGLIPSSLNPQTKDYSWGVHEGTQSSDHAIIKSEYLSTHMPILNNNTHRELLCLTNSGIHIMSKLTPSDILVRLLSTAQQSSFHKEYKSTSKKDSLSTDESYLNEVRVFFERYGAIQASIMCIALACGLPSAAGNYLHKNLLLSSEVNANVASRAIMAMQRLTHGFHLKRDNINPMGNFGGIMDSRLSVRGSVSHDYSTSPILDGLIYLISRIIRPLWLRALVKDSLFPDYVDISILHNIKTLLNRLQVYFEEYHPLVIRGDPLVDITTSNSGRRDFSSTSNVMDSIFNSYNTNLQDKQLHQYAKHLEDSTLNALYRLIARTIQALDLVSYMKDLYNRNVAISLSLLNKFTLKAWVISPKVHEKIKMVVREILLLYTSDSRLIKTSRDDPSESRIVSDSKDLLSLKRFIGDFASNLGITGEFFNWGLNLLPEVKEIPRPSHRAKPLPIIDNSVIVSDFIEKLTKSCYYYFSLSDRYAFDALREQDLIKQFLDNHINYHGYATGMNINAGDQSFQLSVGVLSNIMLRLPSHELRQQLKDMMTRCIDYWKLAIKEWRSTEYVMPTTSSTGNSLESSSTANATVAARNRASYDLSSELSRICTGLRNLGGYCRKGIVDICLEAASNFQSFSQTEYDDMTVVFAPTTVKGHKLNSIDEWEYSIYHGRPQLTEDSLLRARRECYQCLVHHLLQIFHANRFHPEEALPIRNNDNTIDDFEPSLQEMINHSVFACDDRLFHDILFNSLLKDCPKHLIQMRPNAYLDDFLNSRDKILLTRHYEYHEIYGKAASLIASIAQSESSMSIATRTEHLQSAVSNASLALHQKHHNPTWSSSRLDRDSEELLPPYEYYKDLLDVAKLQSIIYETLMKIPLSLYYTTSSHPIIHRLNTELLSLSDLVNQVTQPLCLWDLSLLCMQSAKYVDMDMISRLWKSIIYRLIPMEAETSVGDAFLQAKRRDTDIDMDEASYSNVMAAIYPVSRIFERHETWRETLTNQLLSTIRRLQAESFLSVSLSTKAITHQNPFIPLVIIINELEDISSTLLMAGSPFPKGWIINEIFIKSDLSLSTIVEAYLSLLDSLISKGSERLVVALLSAVMAVKEYLDRTIRNRIGEGKEEFIQLYHDITRGKIQMIQDKLIRCMNTLIGRSTLAYTNNRLNEMKDMTEEIGVVIQNISVLINKALSVM